MRTIKEIFRSYGVVDDAGVHINGTDKETNHHYGDVYEELLRNLLFLSDHSSWGRDSVKLMMEVGIADGSSLLAWREVFPNATCVGLDIQPASKLQVRGINPDDGRFEFHLGDATKKEDCERAANGRQFDLIVDDATHRLEDILQTLFYLWPYVRPGGLYVVEEFTTIHVLKSNVRALFPFAEIVDEQNEPLVVLRKPQ